jgi:hypothetical protein
MLNTMYFKKSYLLTLFVFLMQPVSGFSSKNQEPEAAQNDLYSAQIIVSNKK